MPSVPNLSCNAPTADLRGITQSPAFNRVFVERGGVVYLGYRDVDHAPRSGSTRSSKPAGRACCSSLS